ncbi:hypothetical protein [Paeniglutamicibacter psychrophenolicus]|uniref:hypothetical protein n=1 Tax=Paeniglutamicibacter psychrophenolicus TaxID=257454 RepID=UPI00278B7050|nr:hypothetical protein [Paeniglutamicibacter psychrophenolicus]MDQ0093764.1 hypothetical protein [Paeniglutamicibacter psychrophenolicus]
MGSAVFAEGSLAVASAFLGVSAAGASAFFVSTGFFAAGAPDLGAGEPCGSATFSAAGGSVPSAGASAAFSSVAGARGAFFDPSESTVVSPFFTASSSCCSAAVSWLSTGDATAGLNPPPPNIIVATSAVVALAPTVERTTPFLQIAAKKEPLRIAR